MRDPLTWSLPIGRLFGIVIKVHLLFPFVALALVLRAASKGEPGDWIIAAGIEAILFLSVLLHEFGHCFGARFVDGDAHEILMWPLGGLAYVEVPHTWRANLFTAVAGPLVNLVLCILTGTALIYLGTAIPWSPWWDVFHDATIQNVAPWQMWLARFFWLNWMLFLFNMVLVGFPMDAGRILQCLLWPRYEYRQATIVAIYAGFITAILLAIYSIVATDANYNANPMLMFMLALFIYATCRQQYVILEQGGEDSAFGDFSQGYTSLERDQPRPRRRRPNAFQRWLQRRNALKAQRELEQREAEDRRLDELLQKVQDHGKQSLTDEEDRFLKRVSAKYRNRH